ncbi:DUF4190 and DUF4352 domain-containing protein [Streptomyces sp. MUM 203J]|uniref:DUF4190 domain-containing protein n=1 Tax=Streptomyces sp. MUM 203J TaxID=2791990 RepID=UPI001F0494EC|nr:DUF4190 domain-containing protein [Streptomyces sp. MUM 203J]MCH0538330.1 DUF4190 and DUF4352 domain-containing protein [Streptomyces sp. MUM 203J]
MSRSTHQQHQHGAPSARVARNGLGIAALVLGIIGAVSGLIPLLFWLAGVLGLIALVLGLSGRGRVKRGEATNKGATTVGAALGLLSLVLACWGAYITFTAVSDAVDEIDKALNSAAPTVSTAPEGKGEGTDEGTPSEPEKDAGALKPGATHAYSDGLKVTVSAPTAYTPGADALDHTEGNKAYKVTVTVENGGSAEFLADSVTLEGRAGANGVEAPQIYDEGLDGLDGTVLPGKKATAVYAFDAPADAKTLTVEVSMLDFEHGSKQWELDL